MHTVVIVGPLPPPIHGAARVTDDVLARLRSGRARLIVADTGSTSTGARYHVARAALHLRAVGYVLRPRRGTVHVYLAGAGGLGLWYQALVVAAARSLRRRTTFHHHSFAYLTSHDRAMDVLARLGGRRMDHVALCPQMAARLRELYPAATSVRVCSNAGLVTATSAPRQAPARAVVLGHLGNLMPEKGLDTVLESFRRVLADGIDARLMLAGPAASAESRALLERAAVEFGPLIEHLGPVPADEVGSFYRRVDVFVFPSRYRHEAQPMVVLEAAAHGVPTIAVEVGCLASMVPGPEYLVAPDRDFPAAVSALLSDLADPATRAEVSTAVAADAARRHREADFAQRSLSSSLLAAD